MVGAFAGDLVAHGGDRRKAARTSSEMPNGQMTFGRFRIRKNAVRSGRRGGPRVAGCLRD